MNRERPDEVRAKGIVERALGLSLEHADKNGGVDYRSLDGHHAVEVTRVTDGRRRAGAQALGPPIDPHLLEGELSTCWTAYVEETAQNLKTFRREVHRGIVALDTAGEIRFERHKAAAYLRNGGPLSGAYRALLRTGVEGASAVPHHAHRDCTHRVISLLGGGGGSANGSNPAIELLAHELRERVDNTKKLRASGTLERHLFVWIDSDTDFGISRPLFGDPPSWDEGEFGTPTVTPNLGPAVTCLWVVHSGTGRGWIWDTGGWRDLQPDT